MQYSNYREIARKLAKYEPFTGNTMSATRSGNEYYVYSYSTLIARCAVNVLWHDVPDTKYSVTTSRQQNIVRRAWGIK